MKAYENNVGNRGSKLSVSTGRKGVHISESVRTVVKEQRAYVNRYSGKATTYLRCALNSWKPVMKKVGKPYIETILNLKNIFYYLFKEFDCANYSSPKNSYYTEIKKTNPLGYPNGGGTIPSVACATKVSREASEVAGARDNFNINCSTVGSCLVGALILVLLKYKKLK